MFLMAIVYRQKNFAEMHNFCTALTPGKYFSAAPAPDLALNLSDC
jgi:hypothetical protein